MRIAFMSNHKDTAFIESQFPSERVELIPHPYIEARWTMPMIRFELRDFISRCCEPDILVLNGDYSLVSLIVLERFHLNRRTGFISMEKRNAPDAQKLADGSIRNTNVLVPVGIRYLPRMVEADE